MKQSRMASFRESLLNVGIGFGVSFVAQLIFLPLIGVPIRLDQNFIFACIMTVVSVARTFAVRRLFEALHIRIPISPFMWAAIAERHRQITEEGWSHEHDDKHAPGELSRAGACYLLHAGSKRPDPPSEWRWDERWWKPTDYRRDMVRGCALAIAEGEKFDRTRRRR